MILTLKTFDKSILVESTRTQYIQLFSHCKIKVLLKQLNSSKNKHINYT